MRYGFRDPKSGDFKPGNVPNNMQAAVRVSDSPNDAAIRAMLEPASLQMTGQVLGSRETIPGPAKPGNVDDFAQGIFDRSYGMMQPAFEQEDRRVMNNLQARGIPIGAGAWNEQLGNIQRERGDTLGRLAVDSRLAAGQEQNRLYELGAHERATALGELSQMFGGRYEPAISGLSAPSTPGVSVTAPAMQAYQTHSAQQMAANQANAQSTGQLGSMAGTLGAAAILAMFM